MNDSTNSGTQPSIVRARPWAAMGALVKREWLRFFRQRNRVIGALGQPILFWLLFGVGMNQMFNAGTISFQEYYFPGTMMLIVLFTAIFTTISIIEDRHEGFLQGVLIAPAPRWTMVGGKVVGGAAIALLQALLFFALSLTLGIRMSVPSVIAMVVWLFISAVGLTALGFVIAWKTDSTQGFHAIMSLLLLPMWLLSGAFFPVPIPSSAASVGPLVVHWIMRLNPMTYAMAGLRRLMYADMPARLDALSADGQIWCPQLGTCVVVLLAFTTAMLWLAWRLSLRHTSGDLK
jgi:ABC-2 type transport system permease protein